MSALRDWFIEERYLDDGWPPRQAEVEEEASLDIIRDQIREIVEENKTLQVNPICPMQLLSQMNEMMSKESNLFGQVLYIKGVFKYGNNANYNNYYYDFLKDENTTAQAKILMPSLIRLKIKPDSLVILCGMLTKRVDHIRSSIEILFRVDSLVEEVKPHAIDQDEVKRLELRQRKVAAGFKNVTNILETKLLNDQRPKIALVIVKYGKIHGDFENGKRAASASIDFVEFPEVFTHTVSLCSRLRQLDQMGFDAIALVRGGGLDSNTDVDKPEVIEAVVGMKTPFISGVGHKDEIIFLRQVADKWEPNPQGLGQYFSELVEKATDKRNNSRAILEASVKKQYQGLLDGEKKRNSDLQEQIKTITKTYEQTTQRMRDSHKLSVEALENKLKAANSNNISTYIVVAIIALILGCVFTYSCMNNSTF